jgi:small-conductance mechanosensitive channel
MNTSADAPKDFQALLAALGQPSSLIELAVVAGCLALAWALVRLVRGPRAPEGSIWFGRRIVDGVLFPVVALALVYAARLVAESWVPLAVFRVAVPVLLSLVLIRMSVRVLSAAFPHSALMRAAERTISWLAWIAVVLWITGVLPVLLDEFERIQWKLGSTTLSLRQILEGTLSAGFVMMVALWISAAIESQLLKGAVGERLSLRKAASNAVRAILLFVGLLVALSSVGIGFGLQKLAANYVSGFVILAERSLRIGDFVRVDNFEGHVTDITTRYTVIRAPNGRESIVPNETLITTRVENLSLADRNMLLSTVVQVAYGTEVDGLRARIVERVRQVPRVLPEPGPSAHLTAFASDGLELTVFFWISDPENGQASVRSGVNLAILALFEEEGVEIPYPQRVVHLRTAPAEASSTGPA